MTKIILNQTFKVFHWVVTSTNRWGKGATQEIALTNANLVTKALRKSTEYFINTLILKASISEADFNKLTACWGVNDFGNVVKCSDIDEHDQKLIDAHFVGWASTHIHKGKVVL